MKNQLPPMIVIGAIITLVAPLGASAQQAGGQYMPQYSSTTGAYYGNAAPMQQPQYYAPMPQQQQQFTPGTYASFVSPTSVGSGQMSAFDQQEQAIAQSHMLSDRSAPADFQPASEQMGQSASQQLGRVSKVSGIRGMAATAAHIAGRTVAVGLPVVGVALLAKSVANQNAMMGYGMPMGMGGMPMGYGMPMGGYGMPMGGYGMPMSAANSAARGLFSAAPSLLSRFHL